MKQSFQSYLINCNCSRLFSRRGALLLEQACCFSRNLQLVAGSQWSVQHTFCSNLFFVSSGHIELQSVNSHFTFSHSSCTLHLLHAHVAVFILFEVIADRGDSTSYQNTVSLCFFHHHCVCLMFNKDMEDHIL